MDLAGLDIQSLLITCLIGAAAGWLAALVMRGDGFGFFGNIVIGILGGLLGNWLLGDVLKARIEVGPIWLNSVIISFIGAVLLLFVLGLMRKGIGNKS